MKNNNFYIIFSLILMILILNSALVLAEENLTTCYSPACAGAYNAGDTDTNGCIIYACPTNSTGNQSSGGDIDSCLDNPDNYWDQETNQCYNGFSKKLISQTCSDPDGGINKYIQAHTFGFRSVFADSRDQRIRTGGKDGCLSNKQLIEHYCNEEGYIQIAYLDCAKGCQEGSCIKGKEVSEEITCNFKGSEAGNECYLAGSSLEESNRGITWCKGTESQPCKIKVIAEKGDKLTWKSSCGGYQYTVQDGNDESIVFDCSQGETNISQPVPGNNAFRNAYWQCYDGKEFNLGDDSSCKPYGLWKKYATEACEARCSSGKEKCGVNSFALTNPCYSDYVGEKNSTSSIEGASSRDCEDYARECKGACNLKDSECISRMNLACNKWTFNCNQLNESGTIPVETLICKDSCPLDGKCYPFGYRKSNKFCSDTGSFIEQLESDKVCENNFECSSNVCVSGTCVSERFIQKIISWFKNLFG